MSAYILLFLIPVVVLVTSYPTPACLNVTGSCMSTLNADLLQGEQFCRALSRYFPCVGVELWLAEMSGVCDPLSLLTRKAMELQTITDLNNTMNCPISTSAELMLDACSAEIGHCGQSALNAAKAPDTPSKCREVEAFVFCMATNTVTCPNDSLTGVLVLAELSSNQYEEDCFAVTTPLPQTSSSPYFTPSLPSTPAIAEKPKESPSTLFSTATTQRHTPVQATTAMLLVPVQIPEEYLAGSPESSTTRVDQSMTRDDHQSLLAENLHQALAIQTLTILQSVGQQLQALQVGLPSQSLLMTQLADIKAETRQLLHSLSSEVQAHNDKLQAVLMTQLADIKAETRQLLHSLSSEVQAHNDKLQAVLRDLVNSLGQKIVKLQSPSSLNNDIYSFQPSGPESAGSCLSRLIKSLQDSFSGGPWSSWSSQLQVHQLGQVQETSGSESVMVSFQNLTNRMLVLLAGRKAMENQKLVMEIYPTHLRFTCAV